MNDHDGDNASTSKHRFSFNKIAGNFNEVKTILLEIFSDYSYVDCENKKDAEAIDEMPFNVSRLTLYIDIHLGKMARCAGFKVPPSLKPLEG